MHFWMRGSSSAVLRVLFFRTMPCTLIFFSKPDDGTTMAFMRERCAYRGLWRYYRMRGMANSDCKQAYE